MLRAWALVAARRGRRGPARLTADAGTCQGDVSGGDSRRRRLEPGGCDEGCVRSERDGTGNGTVGHDHAVRQDADNGYQEGKRPGRRPAKRSHHTVGRRGRAAGLARVHRTLFTGGRLHRTDVLHLTVAVRVRVLGHLVRRAACARQERRERRHLEHKPEQRTRPEMTSNSSHQMNRTHTSLEPESSGNST